MERGGSFGRLLKECRRAGDLTQEDLARQVGCAIITIKKIEGDTLRPSRQIAQRLVEVLDIPADECAAFIHLARSTPRTDRDRSPPAQIPSSAEDREHIDLSGRVIKGYELRELIGEGGFGAVYRAQQVGVGRSVAIKVILPQYANHPEFIRRFEVEAQTIARLEHPHIVPLYDYWREPNGAYLVMRYIRGGSLHAGQHPVPWPLDRITRLMQQIGAALQFAHQLGVVHRDIKLANILIDTDGNAYLADFGIAKDLRVTDPDELTQPGAMVGSLAYLSPEQIRDEPVTPQTDIYSLGIVLYELLAGAHPFADLSPAERLFKQLNELLPLLSITRPNLPGALDSVIQRATAKRPAERFPNISQLLADWQRAIASERASPSELLATTVAAATPLLQDSEAAARGTSSEAAGQETVTDLARIENPYKGLRAFTEADAADFFGRTALTERLLERLAEEGVEARFLAVVGPSGSGKSSVVRAGLIPALRRGGLPGSENWFVVEVTPGAHPLEELEAGLLRVAVNPPPSLLEQLQADERGLLRAIKRVLPADDTTELALVIDQFEELFTLVTDETSRAHALNSLLAAVTDPRSRLHLIVTLRADFYDRPLLYSGFGELMRERTEVVLPLTAEELREAITGPAARAGLTLEPGLVTAIIKDVGEQPGTLPLLQYMLTELFEQREGRVLTRMAYQASGGGLGALGRRADELYEGLDARGQVAVRQLFLRLVTLGEGVEDTRRRVRRSELASIIRGPLSVATDQVINLYGRYRLLTFDRDPLTREPTVEVAHEVLIRAWGRLRAWLDESRDDLRVQRRLLSAAAEWTAARRDTSFLASGARLAEFEALAANTDLALNEEEIAFLQASVTERDRQEALEHERQGRELALQQRARNRLRYLVGAGIVFLLVAIGLSAFAYNWQTVAVRNLTYSEAQRLAVEANALLQARNNAEIIALLAVRSMRTQYTSQGDAALAAAATLDYPRQLFVGHAGPVYGAAFSPDGRYVLTGSADKTVRLWNAQTNQEVRQFVGHTDAVEHVAFSPDGRTIVTSSDDKTARLWDVGTGQQLHLLSGHTGIVYGVAFSPDGKYIVSGSQDRTARLWDAQTGQELRRFAGHTAALHGVAFSPNGKYVLTGSLDGTARLWDADYHDTIRYLCGRLLRDFTNGERAQYGIPDDGPTCPNP